MVIRLLIAIVLMLSCTSRVALKVEDPVYEPITLEDLGDVPLFRLGEPFGDVPEVEAVKSIAVWSPAPEVAKRVYTTVTFDTVTFGTVAFDTVVFDTLVLPFECVPVVDTVIEYMDIERDFRWLFMLTNSVSVLLGIGIGVFLFVCYNLKRKRWV